MVAPQLEHMALLAPVISISPVVPQALHFAVTYFFSLLALLIIPPDTALSSSSSKGTIFLSVMSLTSLFLLSPFCVIIAHFLPLVNTKNSESSAKSNIVLKLFTILYTFNK